jgi:predicted nucleic acid-binding protein
MYDGDFMVKIKAAVFDTGPFIHLHEIEQYQQLKQFEKIKTTFEVLEETRELKQILIKKKNVFVCQLEAKSKDMTKYFMQKYDLDLGEATCLSLCKQENLSLFFTDDFSARQTAIILGFEAHGTIAIILRALREKILNKKEAQKAIEALYTDSSLFFTKDLYNWTVKEIERYNG